MNRTRFGALEVRACTPSGAPTVATPLLFIHGAFTGAWCWEEHFLPYFARAGYAAYALSLSGHGASRNGTPLDDWSIDHYVADVAEVVAALPAPPVLIGHSMGGMVIQKYLERADAPAVALLCSVPPQGVMGAAWGLMFNKPALLADLNRLLNGGPVELDSLREALFHQPIDDATLLRYYRQCQPESQRAIWDMTFFNLPLTTLMHRPPMLVLGAEHDHLVPPAQVVITATTYGQQAEILPGMGHGVMLERGWQTVAERIAEWLAQHVA